MNIYTILSAKRNKLLGILLVFILLAGCSDIFTPPDVSSSNAEVDDGLTRLDYLALTRLMESHTTGIETLEKMVNGILTSKAEGSARSIAGGSTVTGVRKVTSIPSKSFSSGNGGSRSIAAAREEPVELYAFEVTDPAEETTGYVLTSNDNRVGNILAIVENGEFDDPENPFTGILHKGLEEYIDTTIAAYANLTEADTLAALEKLNAQEDEEGRALTSHWDVIKDYLNRGYVLYPENLYNNFQVVKAPFITTKWTQKAPYSNYVNYALYKEGRKEKTYVAGCVPVALAQLVTYYQYMNPITPTVPAFSQPTIDGWNPNVGVWTGQYNWAAMKNVGTLTSTNTAMVGQIGVLLYQIGKNLGVTYKASGSTSFNAVDTNYSTNQITSPVLMSSLQAMGYNTGNGLQYSTKLEDMPSGSTIYNYISQSTKKDTLNQGRPYLVFGTDIKTNPTKQIGHVWLIDGYGTMTQYLELLIHPVTLDVKVVTLTLTNCMMVHCNMGNSIGNGWYIDGIFDLGNMASLSGNDLAPEGSPNFSYYVNWMAPIPDR